MHRLFFAILTAACLAGSYHISSADDTTSDTPVIPCREQKELQTAPLLLRTGTPVVINTGSDAEASWTVADDNGNPVLAGKGQGPEITIDTKTIKSGVYHITAVTGGKTISNRIVVL